MFQPGSTCFNLDHCGAGKKHRSQLGHKSQVIVLQIQKQSQLFTDADIKPKKIHLGLRLALVNV